MGQDVEIDRVGRLLKIRLNRPAKKNALTAAMYAAMAEGVREAGSRQAAGSHFFHSFLS